VDSAKRTKLVAWHELCQHDSFARTHKYRQIPEFYTWQVKTRKWRRRRKAGPTSARAVGRMYSAHPSQGERYYLRILLNHVTGATSFEDLRTFDGVVYPTYREACLMRGLLEDDQHWDACLIEAASHFMPNQLRDLFACILAHCNPSDPRRLWDKHKHSLAEDFLHEAREVGDNPSLELTTVVESQAIFSLQEHLLSYNSSLDNFSDMPVPPAQAPALPSALPPTIAKELNYNRDELLGKVQREEPSLNVDQRSAYDAILAAVENANSEQPSLHATRQASCFYLGSFGGAGKTFLINLMLAKVRSEGKIALAMASSGIAALLLDGGTTAHSRLKIPIQVTADSTCSISANSDDATLLRQTSLIVWDEAPMMRRHCFEAVDRTLRDLMRTVDPQLEHVPFGGKVFVTAGDFRQILPVVSRGTRSAIVNLTLNRSQLWTHFVQLKLTVNMRVMRLTGRDATVQQEFANQLLAIGDGTSGPVYSIPPSMVLPSSNPGDLITHVFGDLAGDASCREASSLIHKAVLTPKNDDANALNSIAIERLPGTPRTFESCDKMVDDDSAVQYPEEFLNSLQPQGMPPSTLTLKVGAVIMLLRNMNQKLGLTNGTRLIVCGLHKYVIQARVVTGTRAGTAVIIPRLPLKSSDPLLPIEFTRFQFPIRLAFAMTINKSQGQTFQKVGLYLPRPVFSHGQLYVAMSRVGDPSGLTILALDDHHARRPSATRGAASTAASASAANGNQKSTPNIVFSEVFDF